MKRIFFILIILTFSVAAEAVEILEGYFVLPNNDTVVCKIKGGRFLNNPFYGITTIDEQGQAEFLPGKDKKIIAFGFVEKNKKYDYLYVQAGGKSENGFYQRIINGVKYKLYTQPKTIYDGLPTYILFSATGEFTMFEPCILCPWKKKLRELLKDDAKALELVENAPRVNIPQFVIDINKE